MFEGANGTYASGIYVRTTSTAPNAGAGGDVQLEAADILFQEGAVITAETYGSGQGGSVSLQANNIQFNDEGTWIDSSASGSGSSGSVSLKADNQVAFQGSTIFVGTQSTEADAGNAGNLSIQAGDIHFSDVAQISASTSGTGQGGSVNLNATRTLVFEGTNGTQASGIYVRTTSTAPNAGAGGDVQLEAADILFQDGARIAAQTFSSGRGGSVNVKANKSIHLSDQITAFVGSSYGTGAAGGLRLEAPVLHLDDGATIASKAEASGNAGRLDLIVRDLLLQNGAILSTATSSTGNAGGMDTEGNPLGIFITADQLELQSGAVISSASTATGVGGNAGLVQIDLTDSLRMSGGSSISTATAGQGNAGNIMIGNTTKPVALWMSGGSTIQSGSGSAEAGAGSAGALKIFTGETIDLLGNSAFTTESKNAGGGGIEVKTRDRLRLQDSKITTSVEGGEGQGGNIDIDPIFIILENSQIQANAHGGSGGNISLVADYLLRSGATTIEASSALSTSGDIEVQAVDVDAGSLQAATEVDPLDVTQWQKLPCYLRGGKVSRLIMAGYDAHPTPVDDLSSSLPIWTRMPLGSWRTSSEYPAKSVEPRTAASKLSVVQPMPLSVLQNYRLAAAGAAAGTCDYL